MATGREVGDSIARTMDDASRTLRRALREAMREAAKAARDEFNAAASASSAGGDRRFSNAGAAGRLGTRAKYDERGVTVEARGMWGLAEVGAKPGGRGRHRNHPGTRSTQGQRSWSKGADAALGHVDAIADEVAEKVAREIV